MPLLEVRYWVYIATCQCNKGLLQRLGRLHCPVCKREFEKVAYNEYEENSFPESKKSLTDLKNKKP